MTACVVPLVKGVRDSFYAMKKGNEIPQWLLKSNISKPSEGLDFKQYLEEALWRDRKFNYAGIIFEDIIRSPQPFGYRSEKS